jgi:hypothetical protein
MIQPSGGHPPAGLSATRWLASQRAYLVVFSYYELVMLFLNMVYLIVARACDVTCDRVTSRDVA